MIDLKFDTLPTTCVFGLVSAWCQTTNYSYINNYSWFEF